MPWIVDLDQLGRALTLDGYSPSDVARVIAIVLQVGKKSV